MFCHLTRRLHRQLVNFELVHRSLSTTSNIQPKSSNKMTNRLIWVDCEMTGLNIDQDRLLEIAAIITNEKLEQVDTFGPVCIGQSKDVLENMNPWCVKQFAKNGLTERCLESQVTIEQADEMLSEFLTRNDILANGIIAGNSIMTDRIFLNKFCKKFVSHLHYRIVDVSSVKELIKMWYNDSIMYNKDTQHRALSDIQQSIDELKYYQTKYFIKLENVVPT